MDHLQIEHTGRRHLHNAREILPREPPIQLLQVIPLGTGLEHPEHRRLTLGLMDHVNVRSQAKRVLDELVAHVDRLFALLEVNSEEVGA